MAGGQQSSGGAARVSNPGMQGLPAATPNTQAFLQVLQAAQGARAPQSLGAQSFQVPQMQASTSSAAAPGALTPQINPAALASQIQAQMQAYQGTTPQAYTGFAPPSAPPTTPPAAAPPPAANPMSSTTGFAGPVGSMPQAQYLSQAAAANMPINLVSNPNILTQAQMMQLAQSPNIMALEAANSQSPTITVPWNGNNYIIGNNGYNPAGPSGGGGQ